MESESSRDESAAELDSAKARKNAKEEPSSSEMKPNTLTPHSASAKLTKRSLFPSTPASYSDDDSSHSLGRKKRRKYTLEGREKQMTPGIHLSERQQVLLLKTLDSPKASSPALSGTSSQGPYSASSGTDRIHKRNNRGETLLHIAAHRGDLKLMMELIDQGLDVNDVDNAGWSPLHEACNKGHVDAAKILLDHGAFVNAKGDDDITPLHDAAGSGSVELVKLLLERGADPNARDKSGRYPIDVPGSPTIINEIKNWPTFQPMDESSNTSKVNETESIAMADFAITDSPRLNSAANVVSPTGHSISSSTYDSAPDKLVGIDAELDKAALSPSASSSASRIKQSNDPLNLQVIIHADEENARGRLSADPNDENPLPPLLTPQLPDESNQPVRKLLETRPELVQCSPSPLPPPCLEAAVTNFPPSVLASITSSPPLVVITESEGSAKAAPSGELLLKLCPSKQPADEQLIEPKLEKMDTEEIMEDVSKFAAEDSEQSAPETEEILDDAPKSASKLEPTVASSRPRRKVVSKEAPASTGNLDDKFSKSGGSVEHRKRLGSVGVISPANKDSSSSAESNLNKVQPLRKRLIANRSEDAEGDKNVKDKSKKPKEKVDDDQEHAQLIPDPYEFNEESDADQVVEAATQQLLGTTPTSSPRSSGGRVSPAKPPIVPSSTAQSSPTISTTKLTRKGGRGRRTSSPTPSEQKLPPLKIRLNRAGQTSDAKSESESSISSVSALKAEGEDAGSNDPDSAATNAKVDSEVPGPVEEDASLKQADPSNSTAVPPRKRKVRGSGTSSPIGMLSVQTNVASGASPVVSPSSLPTQEQVAQFFTVEKPRLPNYIKQWHLAREWVTERRKQQLAPAQLTTLPRGVGDFLMIRKSYLLAADGNQQIITGINPNQESGPPQPPSSLALNANSNVPSLPGQNSFSSTLPPQQLPSPTLPPSLQALFRSQEEARHRLRMQHRVEQEKLVLCYEQEVLRAYIHRELTAAQALPLSACAILMERHAAVKAPPEALLNGSSINNASSTTQSAPANPVTNPSSNTDLSAQQRAFRVTARSQRPRLDDLDEKFARLVDNLLHRQRHEAAAMRAVQASEWTWRSEIVAHMAGDFGPTANGAETLQATHSQATPSTVPLVVVPDSLPIPRTI